MRQIGDERVSHSIGEIFLLGIVGKVVQRKDGERLDPGHGRFNQAGAPAASRDSSEQERN